VKSHDAADAHDLEHNEMAHVAPKSVLIGTGAILLVLTVVTVWAARLNFGNVDLWVAMIIATIKATLVALYFMHLRYDKPFHAVVFLSAFAFVTIFLGFALMDRSHYEPDIQWTEMLQKYKTP
jgi:cytochrome c oxidase subunit 4